MRATVPLASIGERRRTCGRRCISRPAATSRLTEREGIELTLKVLAAEPNIKPLKIKHFIDEKTELAMKPKWLVVPQFTAVVQEEEPTPPTPGQAAPNQTAPNQTASTAPLQARLKGLLVSHKELVEQNQRDGKGDTLH